MDHSMRHLHRQTHKIFEEFVPPSTTTYSSTQLNPVPGQQYNCFVLGSEVGPGLHIASIIATGCGGTCTKGTPFRVFNSTAQK